MSRLPAASCALILRSRRLLSSDQKCGTDGWSVIYQGKSSQTEVCATSLIMEAAAKARQEPFLKERRHLVGGSRASCSRCLIITKYRQDVSEPHARMRAFLLRRQLAVELHYFQRHLSRRIHVFHVQPFFDCMNGAHAGAEVGVLDAAAIEDVRIT